MKTKFVHLLGIIIIVLLCVLNVQSHYEIRKVREDYFKRGIYYGVKSLRVLIETKEEDITWNKLYVAAIMMEYDSKEKNPLYDPLKAPLDECQGRGMEITNYYPAYEQIPKTNSVGKGVVNLCYLKENQSKTTKCQYYRLIKTLILSYYQLPSEPNLPLSRNLQLHFIRWSNKLCLIPGIS